MRFTPRNSVKHSWQAWAALLCVGSGGALAAPPDAESAGSRARAIAVRIEQLHMLHVTTSGRVIEQSVRKIQGGCTQEVSSHTDADFTGGTFVLQLGFAEDETAAASYVLSAADFPLRIDLMEMIFATVATIQTTTHWSVMVWEGTPNTGNLVAQFSSDGIILPHIVLPAGPNAVNVAVSVDPGDPEQIIVTDNGSHTFSIGYRIDQHNQPSPNPCSTPPPQCCNAFPTTDSLNDLESPTGNWLNGINCGPSGCPANGGWANFAQLPSGCTPGGDWIMRATWTPLECESEPGACCLLDGGCLDLTETGCDVLGGAFEGEGTICGNTDCPPPTEACCFGEGESCLDLAPEDCESAGAVPQGPETFCVDIDCFATGACCLPDGSCADDTEESACQKGDGTYQGPNTLCDDAKCPAPSGGCCFANDFSLELAEDECISVDADWSGPLTDCMDADGNGTADVCEIDCPEDIDGDGQVRAPDLALLLGDWGSCPPPCEKGDPADTCSADFNGDCIVAAADLALLLGAWGECP